jgi:beta-xylosidase
MQNDSPVNGPHQGALVDLKEGFAFVHFQDMGAYGRVVHLQPAEIKDGWVICGKPNGDNLPGTPVPYGDYPVQVKTNYRLTESDLFVGKTLSLMWQTPANKGEGWYELCDGLRLNCLSAPQNLNKVAQVFTAKITRDRFKATTKAQLNFSADGDEAGLYFGRKIRIYARLFERRQKILRRRARRRQGRKRSVVFSV